MKLKNIPNLKNFTEDIWKKINDNPQQNDSKSTRRN